MECFGKYKDSGIELIVTSRVNQMLGALSTQGLVFKNRHGRYSFAVPLMGKFIVRQGLVT